MVKNTRAKKAVSMQHRLSPLAVLTALMFHSIPVWCSSDAIEFNTDVLDVKDQKNIDISQFSRAGFVMPGNYQMDIHINKQVVTDQPVIYMAPADDAKGSVVCLSPDQAKLLGLKEEFQNKLVWWNKGQCLDVNSLKGMQVKGDLGTNSLYLSIPQAYLEYTAENWDPPALWDDGVAGVLFDYNLNGTRNRPQSGAATTDISGNGTTGANFGPWRLRADWQAQKNSGGDSNSSSEGTSWDWSRFYAYRALKSLHAKMTMGEDYLNSDLFDNFRFGGVSLESDDNMLPPNLRGYAPEIVGVAKTNAKVTVKQQGRVIYETQVASGPFRIQDLNDAVSGKLDVTVTEQDGSTSTFQVDTASIPYLSRPGSVRFKAAAGKPDDSEHHSQGPVFGTGEFSWGINNGWSLYGGLLGAGEYNEASVGIGRDLLFLGAISFDVTRSNAQLDDGTHSGNSYRLSYSKRFDDYDSQITFAGYRFSEKEFMSMDNYLDARYGSSDSYSDKEMYTVTFNKQFKDLGVSLYLNYSHQTYWDSPADDRFNVSLSKYFDIGKFKDVSVNASLYRSVYQGTVDNSFYLSLSLPLSDKSSMGYSGQAGGDSSSQNLSYNKTIDNNNNYSVSAGLGSENNASFNGFYNHTGDKAKMTATAAYAAGDYSSAGASISGGLTATAHGAALHTIGGPGDTRLMVDTGGVEGVPVQGAGSPTHTNYFGKAVISGINSYYRTDASIDVANLSDDVEAIKSVTQATLTEGAIGYRKFDVLAGEKMMALIRLADGSVPPFGATVENSDQRETGIVNDNGMVYLSGMTPNAKMTVAWDGKQQCEIQLPKVLKTENSDGSAANLLLPCVESVN
ncbi:outer membrane usher protein [Hafnia paralvei]|uniref:outer membrane usher protein n=2 Tax=Hafnia paralvei TaxID=546367 RepID=UPI0029DA88A7|nr:outer membrane usher protein [Hafnia paralvei]MDX6910596.1 outer membrane usher protein [Hafnia paralvei]